MDTKEFDRHTTVRLLKIDQWIKQGRYPSVKSMSEEWEVSTRTIQRDIEALRDYFDVNVLYDKKRNGYYYEDNKGISIPIMGLEINQILELFYSNVLRSYSESSSLNWIERLVNTNLNNKQDLQKVLSQHVTVKISDKDSLLINNFQNIVNALQLKKSITIEYYVEYRQADSIRDVDPYHLYYAEPYWYLIGYCHLRKTIRTFLLNNIQAININKIKYDIPTSFSIENIVGNAVKIIKGDPFHIELLFSPIYKKQLEREPINNSQQIISEKTKIKVTVDIDGLDEIIPWILGFGSNVEVIGPSELQDLIVEEIRKMQCVYSHKLSII